MSIGTFSAIKQQPDFRARFQSETTLSKTLYDTMKNRKSEPASCKNKHFERTYIDGVLLAQRITLLLVFTDYSCCDLAQYSTN